MCLPVTAAYIMFKNENPEVQVSYSKFNMLKPKKIKNVAETALLSSLCPYCLNIRLKLQKLAIPGLKMEYDLFNELICNPDHKLILENDACITKECEKCSDWESKIENLLSRVANQDRNITWYTWQKEEITRKKWQKRN